LDLFLSRLAYSLPEGNKRPDEGKDPEVFINADLEKGLSAPKSFLAAPGPTPNASRWRNNLLLASRASEETVEARVRIITTLRGSFAERTGSFKAPKNSEEGRRPELGTPAGLFALYRTRR